MVKGLVPLVIREIQIKTKSETPSYSSHDGIITQEHKELE